jgi:DNA-binding SARP family transcriptional activator
LVDLVEALSAHTRAARVLAGVTRAQPGPGLCFCLLGPFQVWQAGPLTGGQPLDLGPLSQRVVLGMLTARHGRSVDQLTVADVLWGEHPPRSGARMVQAYASRLRRALEPGCEPGSRVRRIVTTPGGFQLRLGADQIDLLIFRRWMAEARRRRSHGETALAFAACLQAATYWRGRPFADLTRLRRLPEVRAIEAEVTAAVLEGAELARALGQAGQMTAALREVSSWHPGDAAVQAALTQTLRAAGEVPA